jgi:hypothetical protein
MNLGEVPYNVAYADILTVFMEGVQARQWGSPTHMLWDLHMKECHMAWQLWSFVAYKWLKQDATSQCSLRRLHEAVQLSRSGKKRY